MILQDLDSSLSGGDPLEPEEFPQEMIDVIALSEVDELLTPSSPQEEEEEGLPQALSEVDETPPSLSPQEEEDAHAVEELPSPGTGHPLEKRAPHRGRAAAAAKPAREKQALDLRGVTKREHVIQRLIEAGFRLKRHGKRHDIYENAVGNQPVVPRHGRDLKPGTIRSIEEQAREEKEKS